MISRDGGKALQAQSETVKIMILVRLDTITHCFPL